MGFTDSENGCTYPPTPLLGIYTTAAILIKAGAGLYPVSNPPELHEDVMYATNQLYTHSEDLREQWICVG